MLEANAEGANRRRAFRVATRLPIRHRRLSPDEWAARERELAVPGSSAQPADPAVAAWLQRVEAKLDLLVSQSGIDGVAVEATEGAGFGVSDERPLGEEDQRDVDLSSVGVRLVSALSLAEGDDVLVECRVPGDAPRHVRALARVARVEPRAPGGQPGPRRVALEFHRIPERDRDALVRFTQDVQRNAIA